MLDYAAFPQQRQALICQILQENGRVVCAELAARLQVSEHTIRRDLHELSREGFCKKVYGGAVLSLPEAGDYSQRKDKNRAIKLRIAQQCARLVKPGGQVFFSTINRNGKAWLMAVVGAEYVMKMVPKGTHDVKKFIKPAELLGWVDQTTLKEQHIIGLHYNPLTNTFKLAPGVDVNYMLHTTAKQD